MKINLFAFAILISIVISTVNAQENICPVLIGSEVPSLQLTDVDGAAQNLQEIIKKQPSVIIFYRGGWCPYCMKHLKDVEKSVTELSQLGYQVIAISSDKPNDAKKTKEKRSLSFTVLSDTSAVVMQAFGIAFDPESKKHPVLPVPSVFLIDKNGKIVFEHVDPKYSRRLDAEILVDIVRAYKK